MLLFPLLLSLLLLLAESLLRPRIQSAAEDHARFLTETVLTEAAAECAGEGLFSYDALMNVSYGENGEILALSSDTAMLHLLSDALMKKVSAKLGDEAYTLASFPLGSVTGSDLFSALGPTVSLRLHSRHTLRAEPVHTWEEAGINQSLHTLSLRVSGTVTVLLSGRELSLSVCRDVPVCQTLLMGKVPQWRVN